MWLSPVCSASFSRSYVWVGSVRCGVHGSNLRKGGPNRHTGALIIVDLSGLIDRRVMGVTCSCGLNPSDGHHTNSYSRCWLAGAKRDRYKPPRFSNELVILKEGLMALERTFSIIKPDATARNVTGAINAMIE